MFRACLLLFLTVLMFAWSVTPANAAAPRITNVGFHGGVVAGFRDTFNACVSLAEDNYSTDVEGFFLFLDSCCSAVAVGCEDECRRHDGDFSECVVCEQAESACESGSYVSGGGSLYHERPMVETMSPSQRLDFCAFSPDEINCGAMAAHFYCEAEHGPGYGAFRFAADETPATAADPTWHTAGEFGIGAPRQPYGTGQGFAFIECAPTNGMVLPLEAGGPFYDGDLDGWANGDDNCPGVPNPFQRNLDGDVFGDACDVEPSVSYACSNGIDDDGDGLIDGDDVGCTSNEDDAETEASLVCDNGLDDDGDGAIDLADGNCSRPSDTSEAANRCGDGLDNDGDGATDLEDGACSGPEDDTEYGQIWTTRYDDTEYRTCIFCGSRWSWTDPEYTRVLGDVNGDGRDDVVAFGRDGVEVALATDDAFAEGTLWTSEHSASARRKANFVVDMDGDGLDDAVSLGYDGTIVSLSTGTGFAPAATWGDRLDPTWSFSGFIEVERDQIQVADLNGDGRPDFIAFDPDGALFAINTGTGLTPRERWTMEFAPGTYTGFSASNAGRLLGDVDGDGMPDVVGFNHQGTWVALGTGSGFGRVTRWLADLGFDDGWEERAIVDLNGDGRDDIVAFRRWSIQTSLSNGAGFEPVRIETWDVQSDHAYADHDLRWAGDLNGDDRADLLVSHPAGILVFLREEDGFGERIRLGSGFTNTIEEPWQNDENPRYVADVDADGLPDLVGFANDGVLVEPIAVPEPAMVPTALVGALALGRLAAMRRFLRRRFRRGAV